MTAQEHEDLPRIRKLFGLDSDIWHIAEKRILDNGDYLVFFHIKEVS